MFYGFIFLIVICLSAVGVLKFRDIQFGILPVDSFVVNQGATKKNLEFLQGMVEKKII